MKKQLIKKKSSQMWSLTVIIVTLILSLFSCEGPTGVDALLGQVEEIEGGKEKLTLWTPGWLEETTGWRDDNGRWNGPVEIIKGSKGAGIKTIENVNMKNSHKHGKGTKETIRYNAYGLEISKTTEEICYNMGREVPCGATAYKLKSTDISAFQILEDKYKCHLLDLNIMGFDNEYVMNYMDTLEKVLDTYEFDELDFYDNYGDATDELSYTPYDSIINSNSDLILCGTFGNTMHSEFRLAVIDRYTTDTTNTYNVFETKYPGYLAYLNKYEISNEEFEIYCEEFEKIMDTYTPMSQDDPLYLDSLTWRMSMAVIELGESEESTLKAIALNSTKTGRKLKRLARSLTPEASFEDISARIIYSVLEVMFDSDPISLSVKESWKTRQGIASLPIATTNQTEANTLIGSILEDGGADVSERGIVWAETYNPTTDNNIETSGSGTGNFSITLDGLTEGTTYYARTYATNSVGTAYGNCVEFEAQKLVEPTDIEVVELSEHDLQIFPNPTHSSANLEILLKSASNLALTIFDIQGKEVLRKEYGLIEKGIQQIPLELDELAKGTYFLDFDFHEHHVTKKLVKTK